MLYWPPPNSDSLTPRRTAAERTTVVDSSSSLAVNHLRYHTPSGSGARLCAAVPSLHRHSPVTAPRARDRSRFKRAMPQRCCWSQNAIYSLSLRKLRTERGRWNTKRARLDVVGRSRARMAAHVRYAANGNAETLVPLANSLSPEVAFISLALCCTFGLQNEMASKGNCI